MSEAKMMLAIEPLENVFVQLEPFSEELKDEVRAALDCDAASWDILVGAAYGPHFDGWWRSALNAMEQGTRIAWAVRSVADGAMVGTTSLYEI